MPEPVDLIATAPPTEWGVTVEAEAVAALTDRWADDEFPLLAFDYPGTPQHRDEAWWYGYVTMATSILACLRPPDGDDAWRKRAEVNTFAVEEVPLHRGRSIDSSALRCSEMRLVSI